MNNKPVLYVGKFPYGKVQKVCKDRASAYAYHYSLVRQGTDVKLHGIFPVEAAEVNIDKLSHVDVSDQLPN